MDQLPYPLLVHIRNWIEFKELHKHRSVCKLWKDIANIEKVVVLDKWDIVGPFAVLESIMTLKLTSIGGSYTEMNTILRLLCENRNSLKKLCFMFADFANIPSITIFSKSFPLLHHVKELSLGVEIAFDFDEDEEERFDDCFHNISRVMPNLKALDIHRLFFHSEDSVIDFAELKNLESICIDYWDTFEIKNSNASILKEPVLHYSEMDFSRLAIWLVWFPNLAIRFCCDFRLDDDFKIKECVWEENKLIITKVEMNADVFSVGQKVKEVAQSLKELKRKMEERRPGICEISHDFGQDVPEVDKAALALIISRMKIPFRNY